MDKDHPYAFVDFPKKDPKPEYGMTKECPVCKGHGGWNLELNAYPLHNYENTPENRHKYSHFKACCSHCNGWGYTREDEDCDGHEWIFVKNLGRCYNQYECSKCGKTWNIDSSD
jgi:RecJ-like exonuclease